MKNGIRRGNVARGYLAFALALAVFWSAVPAARAQDNYPDHPVRVIVPFAAGGVADITIRLVAQKLGEKFGQNFVIENNPGAGGITAARAALAGGTDGYTLTLLTNGTAISVPLFNHLPFDPLKQFTPISTIGYFSCVFGVDAGSPFHTLGDFLKAAREKPGTLNIGTINVGSTQNLTAELFKSMAGVNVVIVPFRATPDVVVALLRKDVQMGIDFYAPFKPSLDNGKMRALATSGMQRSPELPNVPTVQEGGVASFEVTAWNGLFAPTGTPKPIIDKLNGALRDILAEPDLKKRALELGIQTTASNPDELEAHLRGDIEKWGKVIAQAKIPKQ